MCIMCKIRGKWKYIRKYGRHLTEQLVESLLPCVWNVPTVLESLQKKVYYNVTSSTTGDVLYMMNYARYLCNDHLSKNDATDKTISVIGDYEKGKNAAFESFLKYIEYHMKEFDFSPYI